MMTTLRAFLQITSLQLIGILYGIVPRLTTSWEIRRRIESAFSNHTHIFRTSRRLTRELPRNEKYHENKQNVESDSTDSVVTASCDDWEMQ